MEFIFKFCRKLSLSLALLCTYLCYSLVTGLNESVIVIALPQKCTDKVSVSWERGREILPGALEAVDDINRKHSGIVEGGKLVLFVADTGLVTSYNYPYSGNVLEVIANLTSQNARILGIAGLLHPTLLNILHAFQLHIFSLVHFSGVPPTSNVTYMTAFSSTIIDSLLAFMEVMSQTRIGIITEINNSFHLRFLEEIIANVNASIRVSIPFDHHQESFASVIKTVSSSNVYIIVLNVSPLLVLPILGEAYEYKLTWPKYAWILQSYRFNDIPQNFNKKLSIQNILEGLFMFQLINEEPTFESGRNEEGINVDRDQQNPYAYLLYDSVWMLTVPANQSIISNQSINTLSPSSNHIYIYQVVNCTSSYAGVYNGQSRMLENFTIGKFINSDLPVLRLLPSPYFLSLPVLCFVVNTILLVSYIYFRNEPSVKSTSVCLSLLLFIGCYLLIAYTILAIADIPPRIDLCMVLVWLSVLGTSLPLILTTLLVKMLRTYRIFSLHKRVKPKVHTSECAHFLYTVIILSPNVAVLIIWTLLDPHYTENTYVEHPGFVIIEQRCKSDFGFVWFLLLMIYYSLLSMAVVIVAIKSRKIRLAQFKDTKKVNFLIFSILFIGCSAFAYSIIFSSTRKYYYISTYVLYFGHIVIAFLCPITLFVPKVWPPLAAKISKNNIMLIKIHL